MNTAQKQIAPERLLEVVAAVAKEARPHVRAEIPRWAKVVKAAGVTAQ